MTIASTTSALTDKVIQGTDNAIRASRRAADDTLDQVADGVDSVRAQAAPHIDRLSGEAADLARRGMKNVRERADQLRTSGLRTWDDSLDYVKDEPVKAVLIAAATGALIVAILSLLTRSGNARR